MIVIPSKELNSSIWAIVEALVWRKWSVDELVMKSIFCNGGFTSTFHLMRCKIMENIGKDVSDFFFKQRIYILNWKKKEKKRKYIYLKKENVDLYPCPP